MMTCTQPRTRALLIGSTLFLVSCGDSTPSKSDVSPPAPVVDLLVGRPVGNTLTVAWTATGDDGLNGRASRYDVRYSQDTLSESNWNTALRVTDLQLPFESGYLDHCLVRGLKPGTRYYFAVRVADEASNWSELSNVGSAVTTDYVDSIPPARVEDFSLDSASAFALSFSWTAPGDDSAIGRASMYDIRFSVLPISSEIDWDYSARLIGEPAPAAAGSRQSITVTGLTANREWFFAIKAGDEITNWSSLPPATPATTNPAELIPPSRITDLTVGLTSLNSVGLIWTAPGDDGNEGRAAEYDVRFGLYPITEETWFAHHWAVNEPEPIPAGRIQSMVLENLMGYNYYYIAIKTADEIPNWSPISNVVLARTFSGEPVTDTTPPGRIANLTVLYTTRTTVALQWNAPGDDNAFGHAIRYDLRYATDVITESSWDAAASYEDVIPPRNPGTVQAMEVAGLTPNTVYFFAIKAQDEVPNWALLSNIASGRTLP